MDGYSSSYEEVETNSIYYPNILTNTIEVTNKRNTNNSTILKKVDDSETPVAVVGAVFNLTYTNANGENIVRTITTGENGEVYLSDLQPNTTYKLKEIKAQQDI